MIQIQCSECGSLNRGLMLLETEGIFECACCGTLNRIIGWKENCFPVVRSDTKYSSRNRKTDLTEIFLERRRIVPQGYFAY